ncbi:hypothetical protein ACFS27_03205 [Promicromonospora vindobonensis]|uniref:Hemophore-related protein n=1 Tax=Promicromonospora vindobonensis TaxID=195748 RepID=A0ABW5VQP1_9MICO
MKTTTAALAVGAALVVGLVSGAASAGEPVTRTPVACNAMAAYAVEAFQLWADLASATRERGDALGADAYAVHDGDVNHLMASLEAVAPKYDRAVADCVGAP